MNTQYQITLSEPPRVRTRLTIIKGRAGRLPVLGAFMYWKQDLSHLKAGDQVTVDCPTPQQQPDRFEPYSLMSDERNVLYALPEMRHAWS